MGLVVFVQDRVFRIAAHTNGTGLMNDITWCMQPIIVFSGTIVTIGNNSAHVMKDLFESFLHVFGLFNIVFMRFYIETQNRNTIFINHLGIYFAFVIPNGKGFTSTGHSYAGAVEVTHIFFQRGAIAARLFLLSFYLESAIQGLNAIAKTISWLAKTTPIFNMITTREIELFIIAPPGRVNVRTTHAIFIIAFAIEQFGYYPAHVGAGRVMQVFTHYVTAVGQSIGIAGRF